MLVYPHPDSKYKTGEPNGGREGRKPVEAHIRRLIDTETVQKVDQWYESDGSGLARLARCFGDAWLLGLGLSRTGAAAGRLGEARAIGRLKCVTLSRMLAVQGFYALLPGIGCKEIRGLGEAGGRIRIIGEKRGPVFQPPLTAV